MLYVVSVAHEDSITCSGTRWTDKVGVGGSLLIHCIYGVTQRSNSRSTHMGTDATWVLRACAGPELLALSLMRIIEYCNNTEFVPSSFEIRNIDKDIQQ